MHFCIGGGFCSFRTYFRYFHGRFPLIYWRGAKEEQRRFWPLGECNKDIPSAILHFHEYPLGQLFFSLRKTVFSCLQGIRPGRYRALKNLSRTGGLVITNWKCVLSSGFTFLVFISFGARALQKVLR